MSPLPFVLVGGATMPQDLRPTSDADIVSLRSYSASDLENGMRISAERVQAYGLEITKVYAPRPLNVMDTAGEVTRLRYEAKAGGIRANSHIDISVKNGPLSFSAHTAKETLPPLFNGAPQLTCLVQPQAATAAEKWLAVLTQSKTDFSLKHAVDLHSFDAMEVDIDTIAQELLRIADDKEIDLSVFARPRKH